MSNTTQAAVETAAAASTAKVAQTATYAGSGAAVIFGLTANELAAVGGLIIGAVGLIANTILAGHADETLSARAYRLSRDRGRHWPRRVIDALFFWEPGHCEEAHRSELLRRHLPRQYRTTK